MNTLRFAGAVAVAVALGTVAAMAQSGPRVGDGSNSVTAPYSYSGGAAAKVGDGSNTTAVPFSYNVGGGAAHVGDDTDTKPAPYQYYVGAGASRQDAQKQSTAGHPQRRLPAGHDAGRKATAPMADG